MGWDGMASQIVSDHTPRHSDNVARDAAMTPSVALERPR